MKRPAKPYHLGKTLAVGLALAVAFSMLSLFLLFIQARNSEVHLVGEVISSTEDTLTIQNAHGEHTVLKVPEDAKLYGVESLAAIVEGEHIMTKGDFVGEIFEVERLRMLHHFESK